MIYRREIDGLRALAVLPVIFFHAGFKLFSGGFVGVDIFFVISGYLITTIIASEIDKNEFSIVQFYERRTRRILPALFVVMLACIPAAWLLLFPSDFREFSKSVIGVPLFLSNVVFWQGNGYFDSAAELKPLLHTWSLAVEEQYYLLFPILLVASKLKKVKVTFLLAIAMIASLAIAQWGVIHKPGAAFYLLPTRAWELLIGGLAAMRLYKAPTNMSQRHQAASLLGISLVIGSILFYDKSIPVPGAHILAPTIGAALIIVYGQPGTLVQSILSSRILVGVGLISYSAYLWHQPLFAFARHYSSVAPDETVFTGLTALTFLLAYLNWRFIETPEVAPFV